MTDLGEPRGPISDLGGHRSGFTASAAQIAVTMSVVVIGRGGREQAIAWACRRHGHETTLLPELPAADESSSPTS